ncbi:MAG: shikimate dehydrogenase, partial [Clostridia bacterium]|nr:shikimate dehydrogenase [Clostridia bacterium]
GSGFIEYSGISDLKDYRGVVNTTPLGMYPAREGCPVSPKEIKNFKIAVDIVYNPLQTTFLTHAEKLGLKTVRGLYMLVAQAVKAQEIWNGREFGDDIINEIYRKVGEML